MEEALDLSSDRLLNELITIGISRTIKKNVPLSDVRCLMVAALKAAGKPI